MKGRYKMVSKVNTFGTIAIYWYELRTCITILKNWWGKCFKLNTFVRRKSPMCKKKKNFDYLIEPWTFYRRGAFDNWSNLHWRTGGECRLDTFVSGKFLRKCFCLWLCRNLLVSIAEETGKLFDQFICIIPGEFYFVAISCEFCKFVTDLHLQSNFNWKFWRPLSGIIHHTTNRHC